jgi:hypothetical protein
MAKAMTRDELVSGLVRIGEKLMTGEDEAGDRVVFELMNIFRYDDTGHLAEEWIQTDQRSVLRQLGAEGR